MTTFRNEDWMETLKSLRQWINELTCLNSMHEVPTWIEAGIHHGFEGVGYQLPSGSVSLQQVHGSQVIEANHSLDLHKIPEADGLWTRQPGLMIAIKTADCVPILIHHSRLVMALHAGWKGLSKDIIGAALDVLATQNIDPNECRVAIGPAISLDSFEVGPELISEFQSSAYALKEETLALVSSKGVQDRWHLDLGLLAALRFERAGWRAEQLSIVRTCTKKLALQWHSFRRDGGRAGRNWSWIALPSK